MNKLRSGWKDRAKRIARRLPLAVIVPLLAFMVLEGCLRVAGYGSQADFFMPGPEPGTIVSNPWFAKRFFGRQASRAPMPIVVKPAKDPGAFRIFIFGSSAALGDPDCSVSFARILKAMLSLTYPDRKFEVLNTAMTAINSHAVRAIARECAAYQPDLFIVYTGNNEVIGPYGIAKSIHGIRRFLPAIRAGIWLRGLRTGQLIDSLAGRAIGSRVARDSQWQGMPMFLAQKAAEGDPRLEGIYRNYAANIDDICAAGQKAGAEVILCTVMTNLKDCPPFLSGHRPGLKGDDTHKFEGYFECGRAREEQGDCRGAVENYQNALKIDGSYAMLHYSLGACRLAAGEISPALAGFERARDLDMFRFRADSRINQAIRAAAGRWQARGVILADVEKKALDKSGGKDQIPGSDLFYDHVHLNFNGNYIIAAQLFPQVVKIVGPDSAEAPARDDCARWLVFTAFNEFEAAKSMAARMSQPPFSPRQGSQARAEMLRLKAGVTPPALAEIAAQIGRALAARPDDLPLRANYARVLYCLQDNEGAIAQYARLLARYPFASEWHFFNGDAFAALNQPDKAEDSLRICLRLEPAHAEAHRLLGVILAATGRAEEAAKHSKLAADLSR